MSHVSVIGSAGMMRLTLIRTGIILVFSWIPSAGWTQEPYDIIYQLFYEVTVAPYQADSIIAANRHLYDQRFFGCMDALTARYTYLAQNHYEYCRERHPSEQQAHANCIRDNEAAKMRQWLLTMDAATREQIIWSQSMQGQAAIQGYQALGDQWLRNAETTIPGERPYLSCHYPRPIITASRIFAGPNQYPPQDFAAYGILAFRSRPSPHDRDRHLMICHAYVTSLPHTSEMSIPLSEQMVTVWPVDADADAEELNRMPPDVLCEFAVDQYGLVIAKQALRDAELAGVDTSDRGPFLLAWSPSIDKGKQDALVLVLDLSNVTTYPQAQQILLEWSSDIEQDPQFWSNGWNIERVRTEVRYWIDEYGPKVLVLFGLEPSE